MSLLVWEIRVIRQRPRIFFSHSQKSNEKNSFYLQEQRFIKFALNFFFVFIFPPFNLASLPCCSVAQSCPALCDPIVPALTLGSVLLILTTRCHYLTSLNTEIFLCNHLFFFFSFFFLNFKIFNSYMRSQT